MIVFYSWWNNIYNKFDPIAFELFNIKIHWYGLAYVSALLVALGMAKIMVKKDNLPIKNKMLDSYFLWAEIGVILGARIGYILIYSTQKIYYLTNPWQIFNPFDSVGNFIGISGMSYHGALIGFLVASYLFSRVKRENFWVYMDLVAISIPVEIGRAHV